MQQLVLLWLMGVVHNTLRLAHVTLGWRCNCNTCYFPTGVILAFCADKVAKATDRSIDNMSIFGPGRSSTLWHTTSGL